MNIKFESADKINGLMTITIDQADYQEAVDKQLKNYLTESFVLRQKDFSALEEQRKAEEEES